MTMNALPHGALALSSLEEQMLQPGVKGLPLTAPLRQGAIGVQGWNVLHGDTSYPVAVLKTSALRHNLEWMRDFCARHGVRIAPHGKTTMSPQLFGAQLANGAWGITLANAVQVRVAHRFGVRRVLVANQLVARSDVRMVLQLLHEDPGFECVVLADSLAGVARLAEEVDMHPLSDSMMRPLSVLVELGLSGKRAGCRTPEEALTVARAIERAPGLVLAGFEGYEGLLVSDDHDADLRAVSSFVARLCALVREADDEGLFGTREILVTAGGSSYFDLVARGFQELHGLSRPLVSVLRSGCYLTSDHGMYQHHIAALDAREGVRPEQGLRPALEIWSVVQSRPEPGLAILTMGKRDASHDAGLPVPLWHHRPGPGAAHGLPDGCEIAKMNDQHAYLRLPDGPVREMLAVGDLVGCGISHPCTTFDRWPLLLAVDDDYAVRFALNTFF
jgi:D-serine dehydratase